jgi:hypothetical protein
MRRALLPAFLLVFGGVVLGATVFREQIVHAETPPKDVIVSNTSTNPVQVQQSGTSSVSGTVKVDPAGNSVSLDSSDSSHLTTIADHLANIDAAAGGSVSTLCDGDGAYDIGNGEVLKTLCSPTTGSWEISTIVATGMDDNMSLEFLARRHNRARTPRRRLPRDVRLPTESSQTTASRQGHGELLQRLGGLRVSTRGTRHAQLSVTSGGSAAGTFAPRAAALMDRRSALSRASTPPVA